MCRNVTVIQGSLQVSEVAFISRGTFWHLANIGNEEDQGLVCYKHTARGFPFLRSLPRGVSLQTRKQGGSRTKSRGYYTTHLPQCIYKHSETVERQESGLFPSLCITSRYSRFLSPLNIITSNECNMIAWVLFSWVLFWKTSGRSCRRMDLAGLKSQWQ